MIPRRAVGVIGEEGLLGKDIQAREQSQGLVEIEVLEGTPAFLVQELQRPQREQCAPRRDPWRARIVGIGNEPLEAEASPHGQEPEDARDARTPPLAGFPVERATVGDVGEFGTALVWTRCSARRATGAVANDKGGGWPTRPPLRNRAISERSAAGR